MEERTEVFEFPEDQLPLKIHVFDKNGHEVDIILVEDAGVLEMPEYPVEGQPYSVKIETAKLAYDNRVEKAYLRPGWAR